MKHKAIYGIILLIHTFAMTAQHSSDIENSVKDALTNLKVRSAQTPLDTNTIRIYVDTLDRYLYRTPLPDGALKYLGQYALQAYYIRHQPERTDFTALQDLLQRTGSFSALYDADFLACTSALGLHQEKARNYAAALDTYGYTRQALRKMIEEKQPVDDLLRFIQSKRALLYFMNQQFAEAIAEQDTLLHLLKTASLENTPAYGQGLCDLAFFCQMKGDYSKADSCYQAFTALAEKGAFPEALYLSGLDSRASFEEGQSHFQEAIRLYRQLIDKQTPDSPEAARILYHLAFCYRGRGNYAQGKAMADRSLAIARQNPEAHAELLMLLVEWYKLSNEYTQAQEIARLLPLPSENKIIPLAKQAYRDFLNGDYASGNRSLTQARSLADQRIAGGETDFNFGNELMELAKVWVLINDFSSAIHYGEIAYRTTAEQLGDHHPLTLDSKSVLAEYYQFVGDYDRSLSYFRQLAEQTPPDSPSQAAVQEQIIHLHFLMGKHEEARKYYAQWLEQPMSAAQRWNGLFGLLTTLVTHIDLLRTDGEAEQAASLIAEAFEYARRFATLSQQEFGSDSDQNFYALSTLATVHCLNDSPDEAKPYADACLAWLERAYPVDNPDKGMYLGSLAALYAEMKDFRTAIDLSKREADASKQAGLDGMTEEDIQAYVLAESYLGTAAYSEAQSAYTRLFGLLKKKIKRNFGFMRESEREHFFALYRNQLFSAGKYLYGAGAERSSLSFAEVVYDAALFSKGILLNSSIEWLDFIQKSRDPELIAWYEEMRSLRAIAEKKDLMLVPSVCRQMEEKADELETRLVRKSAEYGQYIRNLDVSWKEIQSYLAEGEAAVEFIDFDPAKDTTVYAAVVIKKGWQAPRFFPLLSAKELNELDLGGYRLAEALEGGLHQSAIDSLYTSPVLYRKIWEPLETVLQPGDRIYFSPTGAFHWIAIEYVPDSLRVSANRKYTMYRCSSTRILAQKPASGGYDSAVLYGGINYYTDDETLRAESRKYDTPSYGRRNPDQAWLEGVPLDSLSDKEVVTIDALLKEKGISSTLYTGTAANEESFKALSDGNHSLIHLSTHGIDDLRTYVSSAPQSSLQVLKRVDDRSLEYAALLFSGAGSYAKERLENEVEDGIVTAREIADMNLRNTRLLVTSACKTGLGKVSGEGTYGLVRGFKKAGVKTLVTTLWSVDQRASELMLTEFYRQLLAGEKAGKKDGENVHTAFRNAQAAVRKMSFTKTFSVIDRRGKRIKKTETVSLGDPFFWAGFILTDGF